MKLKLKTSKRTLKPIEVTERDKTVLSTLADFGVLSTEQLFRLCYTSISRARKRLKLLWQHGLVKRNVKAVRMGEGSSQYLYRLTTKGTGILGNGMAQLAKPGTRTSFGDHGLKITDFRVVMTLATRHNKEGIKLAWYGGEASRFMVQVPVKERQTFVPVVPDALFTVSTGNRDFSYFLEIDRGTTDLGRIRTKVLAYLGLWKSGAAAESLKVRSFRVLYVTTSEKRLKNLLTALQSLDPSQNRLDIVQASCFSRYSLSSPERLLEPIWNTADRSGRIFPVSLLPAPIPLKLPIAPGKPPVCEPDA